MLIHDPQTNFARERALLLLRRVGSVARAVAAAAVPHDTLPPRVFVLDSHDPAAAALLAQCPPSKWLAGLVNEQGVSVFALEFTDGYALLRSFNPELLFAAKGFDSEVSPCLVVTEGGYAFLPLCPEHRSATPLMPAVN